LTGLFALGVSHRTAGIEVRERIALPEGRAATLLRDLIAHSTVREAAAVSTCNRTELYLVASDASEAERVALDAVCRQAEIGPVELAGHVYSLTEADAARHLMRVAAGLDSMVLGEAEIQGQVKRAYELALVEGVTGPILNKVFRGALEAGKRVRSETAMGERGVSIPSAALELASDDLGELAAKRVLILGAGDTAEVTARALAARGVEAIFVANRRHNRAIGLAERFDGQAVRVVDLPAQLELADVVVSATDSPHHLIERPELEQVVASRSGGDLVMLDLAVPRDIDPECGDLEGVRLHDVDDVRQVIQRNASHRTSESREAEAIIDSEMERFETWMATLDAAPTISALRRRADEIVDQLLVENEARWEGLTETDRGRLESLARSIASRILHEPTIRLRGMSAEGQGQAEIEVLRDLFGLDLPSRRDGIEESDGMGEIASLDEHRRRVSRGSS